MTQVIMYLDDDVANVLKQEAKMEHLSLSGYCSAMATDKVKSIYNSADCSAPAETTDGEGADDCFRVNLRGDDASVLKRKANELGITPTAWLRNAIHRKDLTIHKIDFADLREMNAIYGRNVSSIEGIVSVCKDNNSVFPQDVERIIELMETIRDQHLIVMTSVLAKRKAEKRKLVKKGLW